MEDKESHLCLPSSHLHVYTCKYCIMYIIHIYTYIYMYSTYVHISTHFLCVCVCDGVCVSSGESGVSGSSGVSLQRDAVPRQSGGH